MNKKRLLSKILGFLQEYILFGIILIVGLLVWTYVFRIALVDYLSSNIWRTRAVWLGNGEFQLFNYTIVFQFEGYSDYSFFYVHWGNNLLNGILPYCDEFGHIELEGITNDNGLYIFPPYYALFYALGIALGFDGYWGIGLLLAIFGYLTVFPTYGIAKNLSDNKHVGEAAALTYLLNPNVLYHIDFAWLNPSPFIFFFFLGFYFLLRDRRYLGTISIVTSALFKQTAWFFAFPLIVFLLIRPGNSPNTTTNSEIQSKNHKTFSDQVASFINYLFYKVKNLDWIGFFTGTIIALGYAAIVIGPFILLQPNTLLYMSLAAGGFPLSSFTELPSYGEPMRLQVLPVVAGLPELAQFLDYIVYYRFLLVFGTVIFAGLMFLEPRKVSNSRKYGRRILYLTLLLMLWVHLTGPRGVFKYYFTLFAPFFSILSSVKMVTSKNETVSFSISMLWVPLALSLMILLPNRNIYLISVIMIFVGYLLIDVIGKFWFFATGAYRWITQKIRSLIQSQISSSNRLKPRRYSQNSSGGQDD